MQSSSFGQVFAPTLLILEESPFWSAEIQRQLGSEPLSIRLRCRVQDAWKILESGRVKMLVIGFDIDLPAVLRLLTKLMDDPGTPRVTVILTPEKADLEWSLRELGAVDILTIPFAVVELVEMVRREFQLTGPNRSAAHGSH